MKAPAQNNAIQGINDTTIKMLFSGGKNKALIISMDDGVNTDRKLVQLLNKYNIKGTFHLNSGNLGKENYLSKEEVKSLLKNHEVSVHSANHPNLTLLPKAGIRQEVQDDRKELERLTGCIVNGMAYPFGNYNDSVIDVLMECGIVYARTVEESYNFSIPVNFLRWAPTIHQFKNAFLKPGDTTNNKKELAIFYTTINNFLAADTLSLLDIWGHSWENTREGNDWHETEYFLKLVANNPAILYTTQIDLVNYINAYNALIYSENKTNASNLSIIDVFIKRGNKTFKIKAGKTVKLEY